MSPLDQLVDEQFRPYATKAFGLAIEKAAEEFVKDTLGTDHFKRLLQASIDRSASAMVTELVAPADVALNRALAVAFEQGLSVPDIVRWLRQRADRLESGQ
jgi:hypothetical protein